MFGRLRFLTAGESHGPNLTAILEGLPAGLPISKDKINIQLARRQKGFGGGGRMKIETDKINIFSGIAQGKSTGAPILMQVENLDYKNWQQKSIDPMTIVRPGHADLTGAIKYGHFDLRLSLERASARETAMRVCVGGVCRQLLAQFGIIIDGYVSSVGKIKANIPVNLGEESLRECIFQAENNEFAFADSSMCDQIKEEIRLCMKGKNTLGGVCEVVALKVPAGLGSYVHWDRRLEAQVSWALMSIPAIKGVEFGNAFENATKLGTHVHDEIFLGKKGELYRKSNNAAGFEGGVTTSEPIVVKFAMKPIATTLKGIKSVDIALKKETTTTYERSDFCAVTRTLPVGEAMLAIVLANALIEKLGCDSIEDMRQAFGSLRRANVNDIKLSNTKWGFCYD